MKKLIAVMLCVMGSLGGIGFAPTTPKPPARTTVTTLTPSGSFKGEIAVDSETQIVHVDGALTTKGNTYQVNALGTIAMQKSEGQSVFAVSGTETIIDPNASMAGSIDVNASSEKLATAVTSFATKVINIKLPQ